MEEYGGYDAGYQEGKRAAETDRATQKAINAFVKLLLTILLVMLVYSSTIFTSWYILKGTAFFQGFNRWEKLAAIIAGAYLIVCLLSFIKGLTFALKQAGKKGWWIISVILFLYICGLPVIAVQALLEVSLQPFPDGTGGIKRYQLWSWIGAAVTAGIICSRYDFSGEKTYPYTQWAQLSGYSAGKAWTKPTMK